MRPRPDVSKALCLYRDVRQIGRRERKVMHPDVMLDIARFRIEELHNEAARARIVKGLKHVRKVPRGSTALHRVLGFGKLRSKTA